MPTKNRIQEIRGDNIPYKLPNDWVWVALKDIAPPDSSFVKPSDWPPRTINYLGLEDVYKGQWQAIRTREINSNEVKSNCVQFDNRHILYSKLRPYLNKVVVPEKPGLGSTEWIPLCPDSKVIRREYLAWFLRSPWFLNYSSSSQNTSGARMPRIRMQSLWTAPVPVPCQYDPKRSLFIQSGIVDRIESLLSEIKEARKLIERMQGDARRVMDARLNELFQESNVSNWEKRLIKDIGDVKGGKRLPKGETLSSSASEWPYLRVVDFKNRTIDKTNLCYLTSATHERIARYIISKEDVYISIAGTIGLVGTIPEELDGANLTENAAKIVIRDERKSRIDKKFLVYFLLSPLGKNQIERRSYAAGQPKLALMRIKTIEILFPSSIIQQQKIVNHLDGLDKEFKDTYYILNRDIKLLDQLEQSILESAFRGKL